MSDKYGKSGWDHKREQLERIEKRDAADHHCPGIRDAEGAQLKGILQIEQYRQMEQRATTAEAICEGLRAELRETVAARVRAEAERDEARRQVEAARGRPLNVARGCHDYGGGYRGDQAKSEAFHHGIQTVINALEAAAKNDPHDSQVNALESIGIRVAKKAATEKGEIE